MSKDLFSSIAPPAPAAPRPPQRVELPPDPRAGHPLRCHCGAWAVLGFGVDLKRGVVGTWRCRRDAIAEGLVQ